MSYRKFSELEAGDKFIRVKDVAGPIWAPLYTKLMAGTFLIHRQYTLPMNSHNSIGGLENVHENEDIIQVK